MAAIHEVAKAAGVSISTVSYALTGKRRVSETTRARVLKAAAELDYQPHAGGRMLAGRRTRLLALAAPLYEDTSAPAHMAFVLAAVAAARRHDYDVVLLTDEDDRRSLNRVSQTRLVDGVVILDVTEEDPRADLVRDLEIPAVLIGIPADTAELVCVDLDFEAAARLAVDSLAAQGHTSIALLGDSPRIFARGSNFPKRFRNEFVSHMASLGHAHAFRESPRRSAELPETIDALLALDPPPTALIMQCNQQIQEAALEILDSYGIRVPEDLSVISAGSTFDTSTLKPALDVIPLLPEASTDAAIDLLMTAMDTTVPAQTKLIPPTYVQRGSVQPLSSTNS